MHSNLLESLFTFVFNTKAVDLGLIVKYLIHRFKVNFSCEGAYVPENH